MSLPANRRAFALGRLKPGQMNKSEEAYARHLDALVAANAIICWKFEPLKLRLANNTFYTPDFAVQRADLIIELHEVKGFWADDARVKIKVAAEQHWWFRFVAVRARAKKHGGGWEEEHFE